MATKDEIIAKLDELRELIDTMEDGSGSPAAEPISIPTAEEVAALGKDEILDLATKLGMNVEGQKATAVKLLLSTLAKINADEDADEDEVNDLAETLGLTPDAKKVAKTVEAIKEWVAALSTAGETSTEENSESPSEETPAADAGSEGGDDAAAENTESTDAPAGDDVDREAVASAFKKFPDVKTMVKQLTAYNAKATDEIEFDEKKEKSVKDAYRKLVAELVDSAGEVTAWGVAYFRENGAWCCGLPLDDEPKVTKASKMQAGKCVVTGKVFVLNEETEGSPSLDEYKK